MANRRAALLLLSTAVFYTVGCGESERRRLGGTDASTRIADAGTSSTAPDAGQVDTGTELTDAQIIDTNIGLDTGTSTMADAGVVDATTADADLTDATPADAGFMDATPVDAGAGEAMLDPTELDFGRIVAGGMSRVRTATITNTTNAPITVTVGPISGADAASFVLVQTATVATLQPNESVAIRAQAVLTDLGQKTATIDVDLCDGMCPGTLTLRAEGVTQAVICNPPLVAFGNVAPSSCATMSVTCENTSAEPTGVTGFGLASGAAPEFTVSSQMSAPTTLAPGGRFVVDAMYCPNDFSAHTAELNVVVVHPNPVFSINRVALTGTGGGVNISCDRTELDFGAVAVGNSASLQVTCTNTGNQPLNVSMANLNPAQAGLTATAMLPTAVPGMGSVTIDVVYTPPAQATLSTTLTIVSDDPDTPMLMLPVTGQAADPSGCMVSLAPASLDFGTVNAGMSAELSATLTNAGTGNCAVSVGNLVGANAAAFALVSMNSGQIGPNQTLDVRIRFAPATQIAAASAQALITTTDVNNPLLTLNLVGSSVINDSVVLTPTNVDFGAIPVGCGSPALRTVEIRNVSTMPLTLNSVALVPGSDPAFAIASSPGQIIAAGASDQVVVSFAPTQLGAVTGTLELQFANQRLTVPLSGDGAASAVNVETFAGQPAGDPVDLLFVVDDSCSMSEEQALLAQVAPSLLQRGLSAGVDYHIGVVTTDVDAPTAGALRGTPAFVDPMTPNAEMSLIAAIMAGTNGSPTETGLAAAVLATTDPALLAGANAGFLRPGAELAIIVLSDEPDQSMGTVGDAIAALRGRMGGGPLVINTITGGANGCQGMNGSATAAPRYLASSALTGGIDESICSDSFADIVGRVADSSFGALRERFQLGAQPTFGSVEVRVDGVLVPTTTGTVTNYGIDYAGAVVLFTQGRAPGRSQTVEIRYTALCVSPTCGDGMLDPNEQCDDGNMVDTDACPSTCLNAACGDSFVQMSVEQCDDGNTIPGDGCNMLCLVEGCGNGVVEPPDELCDNGPNNSDTVPDACRTNCTPAGCGDNVVDMGEQCDDGNNTNTDACIACVNARCGDGFVQAGVEQCDNGNMIDTDLCTNNCILNIRSYTVTTATTTFVATPGGTPVVFNSLDDGQAIIPIGFTMDFIGTMGTDVALSTNGFLSWVTAATNQVRDFSNDPIPSGLVPNGYIAWWWDDLRADQGANITTQLTGVAPNRVRVITLQNVPPFNGGQDRLNAEIRLFEGTSVVEVHYGPITNGAGQVRALTGTIGWEDATGMAGTSPLACTPGCTITDWPAGSVITYTP